MAMTVYKTELMDRIGVQKTPLLPRDAVAVHVGMQSGSLMLWYETRHSSVPEVPSKFAVFGTGHAIPDFSKHIGSCQDGDFVWHVYELV